MWEHVDLPDESLSAAAVSMSRSGAIGRVHLERPEKANALRIVDKQAVAAAIRVLAADELVRVILIESTRAGVFCAGTDLHEMAGMTAEQALEMFDIEARMFEAVLEAPVPVVAAVDGVALGAGCILAFCADLCVVTDRSRLGQPEVRNAVPAPAQVAALTYIVGFNRARSLLLTGRELSGTEAEDWGLVHRSVAAERHREELDVLLAHLVSMPRRAMSLQKQILGDSLRHGFVAGTASSQFVAAHAFSSGEPLEAIDRFLTRNRNGTTGGDPA